jgi:xanthine dehydrogenase accessory factor
MIETSATPATRPRSVYHHMASLAGRGVPFAVATVVRTTGSTPQGVGAKIVVTADLRERPAGTLGGGCVEADAIEAAREVLARGGHSLREYHLNEELAWNTGLVCGGSMWILAEEGAAATSADGASWLNGAVAAISGGAPLAFVSKLRRRDKASSWEGRVVVLADGQVAGTLGSSADDERARELGLEQIRYGTPRVMATNADAGDELFIEPITSRPRLVVAGGGHVAKAIAKQAKLLDYDVTILEDRPEFADPERFDGADVINDDVPRAIAAYAFTPQTYLVIATRGHKLDADCVLAAARTSVPYIGLLGSRRKTVLVEELLHAEGVAGERVAAIHAPVGLDLGGRTPAEIALAILAEITQLRYSGSGLPLAQRSGG